MLLFTHWVGMGILSSRLRNGEPIAGNLQNSLNGGCIADIGIANRRGGGYEEGLGPREVQERSRTWRSSCHKHCESSIFSGN